jgi:excisionase family DNA binding protein
MESENTLVTVKEAAIKLKMNHQSVRKLIYDKVLKASKINGNIRIKQSDIDKMLENNIIE